MRRLTFLESRTGAVVLGHQWCFLATFVEH
jgi:hypothetical protein